MFQALRKAAVVAVVVGFAGAAQASVALPTYAFDVLDGSDGYSANIAGSFDHTFSFIQAAFPAVSVGVVGGDLFGDLSVKFRFGYGITPNWLAWSTPDPVAVPSDVDGNFAGSATIGGLAQGQTYWLEFMGNASQAGYTLTLAPVPEPESWALLLGGLGLLGIIARRRLTSLA